MRNNLPYVYTNIGEYPSEDGFWKELEWFDREFCHEYFSCDIV